MVESFDIASGFESMGVLSKYAFNWMDVFNACNPAPYETISSSQCFFFFRIWKTSGWFHTRLSISNYSCDRYLCQQKTWIDYNLFVISTQSSIVMYA